MIFVKQYSAVSFFSPANQLNMEIDMNKGWKHEIKGFQLDQHDNPVILVEWVGLSSNEFKRWQYREDFIN